MFGGDWWKPPPPEVPRVDTVLAGKRRNKKGGTTGGKRKGGSSTFNLPVGEPVIRRCGLCILLVVLLVMLSLLLWLTQQPATAIDADDVNYHLLEQDRGTDTDTNGEEEDLFEAIDKLTAHGINAGGVTKLQDARIYTCNGLTILHSKKNLTGIKGLSKAKIDKICEAVEKIVNFGYITGSRALLKRESVVRITTGSQALDELLGDMSINTTCFLVLQQEWLKSLSDF